MIPILKVILIKIIFSIQYHCITLVNYLENVRGYQGIGIEDKMWNDSIQIQITNASIPITAGSVMNSTTIPLNLHHSQEILTKFSPNRIHYSRTVLSNNIKCYPIQYIFQKWNCYGIVPFQANLQFNSHSSVANS